MCSCAGAGDRDVEMSRGREEEIEEDNSVTRIFLVGDSVALKVILRPLLFVTPGGDAAALAVDWEEVVTDNSAAEDATGASSNSMMEMIDVGWRR